MATGDCVRDHPLVGEEVQERVWSLRDVESLGISQEARRQVRKRLARIPRARFDECSCRVVHMGSCGIIARGEGAD